MPESFSQRKEARVVPKRVILVDMVAYDGMTAAKEEVNKSSYLDGVTE